MNPWWSPEPGRRCSLLVVWRFNVAAEDLQLTALFWFYLSSAAVCLLFDS